MTVHKFDPPLQSATLIKRYKRFLADIRHPNGDIETIHCANTGAMTGCANEGDTVWYNRHDNPKRKYPCSWQLSQTKAGHFICVNTVQANTLTEIALKSDVISALTGYQNLAREVKYGGENSKIDFLLSQHKDQSVADAYVEVKSATLLAQTDRDAIARGCGYFPDAVTSRGQKHLRELMAMKSAGYRAVLIFAVLHTGIKQVSPASHVDLKYSELLKQAIAHGVEVLVYGATIDQHQMALTDSLPLIV
ncbi:DNA/RNA nuclease SfsA [Endozoicomonas sp. G2_1]|uniref:DNA/RNA nuclease SfsA n=1 Tax=Endozoicomonas sp. G2_1 TaxID=2821091 RepID=UPI001ADD556F|nr:DNA/RNA nuclease SfsA [Endozoicomonas sp. G2_1]MBO9491220.1 DNA/RNA nuclease SfsA [Endozoicomonas sp. G2_1]